MPEGDTDKEESTQPPLFTADLTEPNAANYVTGSGEVVKPGSEGSGTDDIYEN